MCPNSADLVSFTCPEFKENRAREKEYTVDFVSLSTAPCKETINVYHLLSFPLWLKCKPSFTLQCVVSCCLQNVAKWRKYSEGTALCLWHKLCFNNFPFAKSHLEWLAMLEYAQTEKIDLSCIPSVLRQTLVQGRHKTHRCWMKGWKFLNLYP